MPKQLASRFPEAVPMARGATGTLYRVDDVTCRVLKVLTLRTTPDASDRARYRRELQKQFGLAHPNLPSLLEEGEADGRVWLLRDFVRGESLAVHLHKQPLPLSAAIDVLAQVSAALDGLHRRAVVHGDIKPEHVVLAAAADGRLGAWLIDAGLTQSRAGAYAAPEVKAGRPGSQSADLYALGQLGYELLSQRAGAARVVAAAESAAAETKRPVQLDEALPAALRALIESLLSPDPRRRPFSAQQVRRSLEAWLDPAAREPAEPMTLPPAPPEQTVGLETQDLAVLSVPASNAIETDAQAARAVAVSRVPAPRLVAGDSARPDSLRENTAKYALARKAAQEAEARLSRASMPHLAPSSRAAFITHSGLGPKFGAVVRATAGQAEARRSSSSPPTAANDGAAVGAAAVSPEPVAAPGSSPPPGAADALPRAAGAAWRGAIRRRVRAAWARRGSRSLSERPSIVLWSAGALMLSMGLLRVVRGPAATRVRPAVVQLPLCRQPSELSSSALDVGRARSPGRASLLGAAALATGAPQRSAPGAAGRDALGPDRLGSASDGRGEAQAEPAQAELPPPLSAAAEPAPAAQPEPPAERARQEAAALEPQGDTGRAERPGPVATPVSVPSNERSRSDGSAEASSKPARRGVASGPRRVRMTAEPPERAATQVSATPRGSHAPASRRKPGAAQPPPKSAPAAAPAPATAVPSVDDKTRARQLFQARRFREAAEAYRSATQHHSADAGAFAGLGASWLAAGDVRAAVAAYQRAVQIMPQVSGFHAALGRAYLVSGDRARARAAYARALELDPNNRAARSGLAATQ